MKIAIITMVALLTPARYIRFRSILLNDIEETCNNREDNENKEHATSEDDDNDRSSSSDDDDNDDDDYEFSREDLKLERFSSIVKRKENNISSLSTITSNDNECNNKTKTTTTAATASSFISSTTFNSCTNEIEIKIECLEYQWIRDNQSKLNGIYNKACNKESIIQKNHPLQLNHRTYSNSDSSSDDDSDDDDNCSEALAYDPQHILMICSQYPIHQINEVSDDDSDSDNEDDYELTHSDVQLESCYSIANRKEKEVMERFKQVEERELNVNDDNGNSNPYSITTKRNTLKWTTATTNDEDNNHSSMHLKQYEETNISGGKTCIVHNRMNEY